METSPLTFRVTIFIECVERTINKINTIEVPMNSYTYCTLFLLAKVYLAGNLSINSSNNWAKRLQALELAEQGLSQNEITKRLEVSRVTLWRRAKPEAVGNEP